MAGLAITAGAFGAHGLDSYFVKKYGGTEPAAMKTIAGFEVPASWKYLEDFKTGARYQMYSAMGLIVVGLLSMRQRSRVLQFAGWSFLLGIVGFSGSLYVLTIAGPKWLGITWGLIAPIGGLLMIIAWVALATAACGCCVSTSES